MWFTVIKKREGLTHTNYLQKHCLIQRDHFECRCLLSVLWYCTQVLPITSEVVRHFNTKIAWFTWKGNICRIPLTTLHLPRQECGLGLLDIRAKFHTQSIKDCIQLLKTEVSSHGRMACTMFCIVSNQPARHKCFEKRTAEHLLLFPRDMLLDTGDHGSVRTRITEPIIYPFPIPSFDPFSDGHHGDKSRKLGHAVLDV